jgi:hypothetical protein
LSFVLADGFHTDGHGKTYLLGIYNSITVPGFPCRVGRSVFYACFASGRGEVKVTVRLTDASEIEGAPLFSAELPVSFPDPLATPEVGAVLPEIVYPRAGLYAWQVVCGGEVIYERPIPVRQLG